MKKTTTRPTITIIGSGYVGVTSAAVFASAGYKVYVLENNPKRLATIKKGRSFFYEDYLDPLLKEAVISGMLVATNSYKEAIPTSDIVFSCVGTLDNSDGSSNLSYVYAAATETAMHAKADLIYVQKSTVPVGTGSEVEDILHKGDENVRYVSNPEFLREGTALHDSLWFDRIVVGGSYPDANESILAIYRHIAERRDDIAASAGMQVTSNMVISSPTYITTSRNSAELIKVSANAFLALKISFANSIAKLADAADADVVEVMDGIGADSRIGRSFLDAGRGYGGGCFPKDVSSLISSGLQHGVDISIMRAASRENHSMPSYILEKALRHVEGESFAHKKVALLGVTFKAGTSDIRKSPAIKIANILVEKMDADVHAYDPRAFIEDDAKEQLHGVTICPSVESALKGADVVIVATDWPEFKAISSKTYASLLKGTLVVDAMNCLDPAAIRKAGLIYVGVGR